MFENEVAHGIPRIALPASFKKRLCSINYKKYFRWTLVIDGASHRCCYYLVLRTACSDWSASQTSLLRKLLASRVGASHPLVLCTSDISNAHLRLMHGCSGARGNVKVSVFFFLDVCAFICGYVVSMIFPGFQINECISVGHC